MSGKAVVKLTVACFLASCYYSPAPVVIITPAGTSVESRVKEPVKEPVKEAVTNGGGPGGTLKQVRGNCVYTRESIGGVLSERCEYSINNLLHMCLTNVPECTSTPPSGKCSTTQPVAVAPSPCP